MNHAALARSLADHLRGPDRMVWCDMQLGPHGSPRPDVYTLYKSYTRPTPISYECKVSLSDFRADVTTGKWQSYLSFSSGVYFACEVGLVTKNDVPEHCGLIVLQPNGSWRAAKRATLRPVTIGQDAFLKLVIDGVEREGPRYRVKPYVEDLYLLRLSLKFGDVAAKTIRDRMRVEDEIRSNKLLAQRIIDNAKREAERIIAEASDHVAPLRRELCEVLDLAIEADRWQIKNAVGDLRRALAEHPAHEHQRRLTEVIRRALESHGYKEPETRPVLPIE